MSQTVQKTLYKGLKSNLGQTAIGNNVLRFTTDTKELFLDLDQTTRIQISNVVTSMTQNQILTGSLTSGKIYLASDTLNVYAYNGSSVKKIGGQSYDPTALASTDNQSYYPVMYGSDGTIKAGYSTGFSYNPNSGELRANGISIRKTVNAESNTTTIDISIV